MRDYLWRDIRDLNKPSVRFLYFMLGVLSGMLLGLYFIATAPTQ